jgi:hypothetical protein
LASGGLVPSRPSDSGRLIDAAANDQLFGALAVHRLGLDLLADRIHERRERDGVNAAPIIKATSSINFSFISVSSDRSSWKPYKQCPAKGMHVTALL